MSPCDLLPEKLRRERGLPGIGVYIWRHGETDKTARLESVEQFLSRPQNFGGRWLIDGGWGLPPGPICVEWAGDQWRSLGFPPHQPVSREEAE